MSTSEKEPSATLRDQAIARVGRSLRGKFRLDALLGVGGMGSVYAATHRNGSRVAIKLLHDHVSRHPDVRRLFRREALAANLIDHPAVVRVLDDDVSEDGCAFLVMPLLSGETLEARRVRLGGRVPLRDALIVANAVLDALEVAHAQGIVHRDIKPDNLFISEEGEIRILDFGVARLLTQSETSAVTQAGQAIGTPAFMPPEQALGRPDDIDGQSDVWAVGATLFTCLAGRPVHLAEGTSELLILAATRAAPRMRTLAHDTPDSVGALIDKALAFAKGDRWPSAGAMKAGLRATGELVVGDLDPLPVRVSPQPRVSREDRESVASVDLHSDVTRAPRRDAATAQSADGKPPIPRWRRARWFAAVAGALAGLVAIRQYALPSAKKVAATAPPSRAAVEVTAAYQSWHDGAFQVSATHVANAIAEDPTLARPQLLLALELSETGAPARSAFKGAWEYRSQLSEADTDLLYAYQPALADSPDLSLSDANMSSVYRRHPTYDLAAYAFADADIRVGYLARAQQTISAFLKQEPQFPAGLYLLGYARAVAGDAKGARDAYQECLHHSPYATDCLEALATLDANEGRCVEAESLARTWTTAAPNVPRAFRALARAQFSVDGSLVSARAVLSLGLLANEPADRPFTQAREDMAIDILRADFDAARTQATEATASIWDLNDEDPRAEIAVSSMNLELELGHSADALRIADAFGARHMAPSPSSHFDYNIIPARTKYLAGFLSRGEFVAARDSWLAVQAPYSNLSSARARQWLMAYAEAAITLADAQEAIDALPRFAMVDPATRDAAVDLSIGRVYLLRGSSSEAKTFLERAAHSCRALDDALSQTIAQLYLGIAFERTGEIESACAAYAVVLSRWGSASESQSAVKARERTRNLHCSSAQGGASAH